MSSIRCDIYDPKEYDIWFAAAPYGAANKPAKTLKTWAAEEQADVVYNLCLFNMTGSGSDQYGVIKGRTLQYLRAKNVDCGYGGTSEHLTDTAPPTKREHAGGTGFVKPCWDEEAETWVEGATAGELTKWESEHPAPAVDLDTLRAAKQEQNKRALADWLSAHPLTWTDGNVYGVTEQDQTEMAYNLTKFQFQPPNQEPTLLEWHAQKKERHTFTLDEYKDLFFAIDSYVEPYRRYQESVKQAIYKAETAQEIESIQIDYSSVVSNNE